MRIVSAWTLVFLYWTTFALAHDSNHDERLPTIGPAPNFTLTSHDGAQVALADYRGKVVAVTFIFASCTDTCPVLTDKMARIQHALGSEFGSSIAFLSITVDPVRDTPDVLKAYAETFDADPTGWAFLTGTEDAIRDVIRRYGVVAKRGSEGDIDHTFLTSLIDADGMLRIQYVGVRFDPDEFRYDLLNLANEHQ